jgi:hypothetical protein
VGACAVACRVEIGYGYARAREHVVVGGVDECLPPAHIVGGDEAALLVEGEIVTIFHR